MWRVSKRNFNFSCPLHCTKLFKTTFVLTTSGATLFIEHNLALRREFAAFWPSHLLAVGSDDIGNILFLDVRLEDAPVMIAWSGECAEAGALVGEVEANRLSEWLGR